MPPSSMKHGPRRKNAYSLILVLQTPLQTHSLLLDIFASYKFAANDATPLIFTHTNTHTHTAHTSLFACQFEDQLTPRTQQKVFPKQRLGVCSPGRERPSNPQRTLCRRVFYLLDEVAPDHSRRRRPPLAGHSLDTNTAVPTGGGRLDTNFP